MLVMACSMIVYYQHNNTDRNKSLNNTSAVTIIPKTTPAKIYQQLPIKISQQWDSPSNGSLQSSSIPIPKPVHFDIDPGDVTPCGTFCRQTTPTITNTGDDIAYNTYVGLNISNNVGENVYSKQEFLGDIYGGQSKSSAETINVDCGLFLINCLGHTPFTMKVEITWNKGNQTFFTQVSG